MKLSEAISLGSTLNPQAFGKVIDARGGRCAWGAAFEAMGLMAPDQEWSWTTRVVKCPNCYTVLLPVHSVIIHLNDHHRWTRQQIGEWIATIEPTDETSPSGEEFSCVP